MQQIDIDLNNATYVGIDAHPTEHTAVAVNRFEEEKGTLNFKNSRDGIQQFLSWLQRIDGISQNVVIGIEGRGGKGSGFILPLVERYEHVYEINPQFTKQRRRLGTRGRKSDVIDAKCIAEVVIRKLPELPKITSAYLTSHYLSLKKLVWFYGNEKELGAKIKNQLHQLQTEHGLSIDAKEKKLIARIIREKQKELKRIGETKKDIEAQLNRLITGHEKNLTTIPGIGIVIAAEIAAHADERFTTIDKYLQYAGISPLEKGSGKKIGAVQNHKGNRQLNSAFYMAALNQISHNPKGLEYYRKKLSEGKTKKHALRCVMKRIAMIVYGMLRNGEDYRLKKINDIEL